jgi:hypothetical protein
MSTTSNRRQAFAQPATNPATKFIEWKNYYIEWYANNELNEYTREMENA